MFNPNVSMPTSNLKRLIPAPIKRAAKDALRRRRFLQAMRMLRQLPIGELPDRKLLIELQAGWGNESFAARSDYLEEVIRRAATTTGPILECGSGLTSILMGLFAGRRGIQTWSLEHTPEWRDRLVATLKNNAITNVNVLLSPMRDYGGFSWYDPQAGVLPERFSMVVCDGPPGTTAGGRYGLLPVLGSRLSSETLILVDDADRKGEAHVLRRWSVEFGLDVVLKESATGGFALVSGPKV